MDHLTCIIDLASKHEMELQQDAERSIRDLVPTEKDEINQEDLECSCCGIPDSIDPRRAKLGYLICFSCQEYEEKVRKRHKYNRRCDYDYDE